MLLISVSWRCKVFSDIFADSANIRLRTLLPNSLKQTDMTTFNTTETFTLNIPRTYNISYNSVNKLQHSKKIYSEQI